jgi:hypothetical protein
MRASEILRKFADMLDQGSPASKHNRLTPVDVEPGDNGADQPKMVPPLQAKLEILKKSEGLPNVYDECACDEEPDELDMIKKRAGITTSQIEASEDNDITG